jgi:DNA-binding XRE family transcriptional regulator
MIKNDVHYENTKYWVGRFYNHLNALRKRPRETLEIHPLLAKAQEDAAASVLQSLKNQMSEYESLKSGQFPLEKLNIAHELPFILIKARIAQGLSQKDLAEQVGLEEHQIQQYEAKDYESATLATIRNVATVLYCGAGNPALAIKSD